MAAGPTLQENELAYSISLEESLPKGLAWDDFRIFLAVVQTGSVNRAAAHLGLSQPTASRRLRRLEKRLGVRLFDRDRTGPRLTHHGRRILNDVTAASQSLGRASRNAGSLESRIEGSCSMVMGDGLATYWMSRFLGRFYEQHPNIELKLFVAQDTVAGKNESYDIQIHYYEPVEVDPIAIRLGTMHFVPFASRAYLEKNPLPKNVQDLSTHRLLEMAAYRIDKGPWSHWLNGAPSQTAQFLTNQSGPLCEAVRQGVGIALLPTYIATIDDRYVPLDVGFHLPMPIFMSFQRDVAQRWPVRATINFMRDVVFERKSMPWFGVDFVFPNLSWSQIGIQPSAPVQWLAAV
jgi:DNA-binding transcriptional LysR family regulator